MNKKAQLQFTYRCAVLLESGISLSETLNLVVNLEQNKKSKTVLDTIRKNVEKGLSLSKSIILSKAAFDSTLFSMITFGESSGILAVSLRQALSILEKNNQIKKKLVGALVYPGFIALATAGMTLFLVMYIFPKIIPLFVTMDIKLPLLTRMVQALYGFLVRFGLVGIFMGVSVSLLFLFLYKKKRKLRLETQTFLFKLPILGELLKKYFISTHCRSIGTLLECGQTLPVILRQIGETEPNEVFRMAWTTAVGETNRGVPLSVTLRGSTAFPPLVPDMLSIGERTGSLAAMFQHISRMYEEELDGFIKQLSTILEPVLMMGMGLIVGSIALSIILPIYEITNHLAH